VTSSPRGSAPDGVVVAGPPSSFPRIRHIAWFEWRKFETEVSDTVDWRISAQPALRAAFLADLPDGYRFAAP
jgi:hypothetical protein